jgi:phosphatidylinositol alpha-mannosyltransferase
VRRGAERFLDELSKYLARRGHDVTVLTSTPEGNGRPSIREHGVVVVEKRQIRNRVLELAGLTPDRTFLFHCLPFMVKNRFDVMHCIHFHDACAARLAGTITRTPYVLNMNGIPIARFLMRRPLDFIPLKLALGKASDVVVLSRVAAENLESQFKRGGALIPPPCDLSKFQLKEGRDLRHPRILAVGAFGEQRKGARVLTRAFERLKATYPGAILQFSGDVPEPVRQEVLGQVDAAVRNDIRFLGVGSVGDLPELYREAAVTVLPSLFEAFGMVLVESLACGTPVVGSEHGGIPDIVDDEVGRLFHPGATDSEPDNDAGLHRALLDVLALYADPQVARRCRGRAERFGWDVIGPQIEELYRAACSN